MHPMTDREKVVAAFKLKALKNQLIKSGIAAHGANRTLITRQWQYMDADDELQRILDEIRAPRLKQVQS